jgi:hypothetical protein
MNPKNSPAQQPEKPYKVHMRSTVYETTIVRATSKQHAQELLAAGEIGDIDTEYIDNTEITDVEEI